MPSIYASLWGHKNPCCVRSLSQYIIQIWPGFFKKRFLYIHNMEKWPRPWRPFFSRNHYFINYCRGAPKDFFYQISIKSGQQFLRFVFGILKKDIIRNIYANVDNFLTSSSERSRCKTRRTTTVDRHITILKVHLGTM